MATSRKPFENSNKIHSSKAMQQLICSDLRVTEHMIAINNIRSSTM